MSRYGREYAGQLQVIPQELTSQVLNYAWNRFQFPMSPDYKKEFFCRSLWRAQPPPQRRRLTGILRRDLPKQLLEEFVGYNRETANASEDELLSALFADWESNPKSSLAEKILAEVTRDLGKTTKGAEAYHRRIRELQEAFALSDVEVKVLTLLYCHQAVDAFNSLCRAVDICLDANRRNASSSGKFQEIAWMTGLPAAEVRRAISPQGGLISMRLMDEDLELQSNIIAFISGLSSTPLSDQLFRKVEGEVVPMQSFCGKERDAALLGQLVRGCGPGDRLNILFYGEPGTGKTEFAKSLSKSLGRTLYEVRLVENDKSPEYSTSFRVAAFKSCLRSLPHHDSIVLVDEAENILGDNNHSFGFFSRLAKTGGQAKCMSNELLDNGPGVRIWIVNDTEPLTPPVLRRFDYAVEFLSPTPAQRVQLWKSVVAKHQLHSTFPEAEIRHMAQRYEVAAGGMDVALRNYRRLAAEDGTAASRKLELLDQILQPHLKLLGLQRNASRLVPVENYSLEGLNTKGGIDAGQCLKILRQFLKSSQAPERTAAPRNLNCLLHGPPGTGKTEFVKFLANELQIPLHYASASEFLDKYVGGTEANIRQAFTAAQAEGALLFLDEVDSLLQSRDGARQSWEVTQVNELLCQMEGFQGILACATNTLPRLDAAALRRFSVKMAFDYLDGDGVLAFYRRMLSDLATRELGEGETRQLRQMELLAPGDFKVVRQQRLMLGDPAEPTALIAALTQEAEVKSGGRSKSRIGFCA